MAGPLTGTLVCCFIKNDINEVFTLFILLGEDIFGNVDQVAAQLAFVPFGEGLRQLFIGERQTAFQHRIGFGNQLHVAILDAVMNHLHIMASAISTDIGDTRLTVFSNRGNLLQNRSNKFIGFFLATRHDGRPFQSSLFTTGNTCTDKVKTFGRQFTVTTDGVLEEGVAAINDDVAFIEVRLKGIDGAVGASPSLHHQQDTTWCFKGFNKLLYCVVRDQFLAGVFGNYFIGLFTGAVENGDGIAAAFDVER